MLTPTPLPSAPEAAVGVLTDALSALSREHGGKIPRDAALAAFRRHLARIQTHVREAFEQDQLTGLQAGRLLAALTDGVIDELYNYVTSRAVLGPPDRLSLAATGGYGRGLLAPFSDIDLLFLTPKRPNKHTLQVVEFILYFLWDLGLKVGHATRSIDECLSEGAKDATIRTSLLDARHLTGEAALFQDFHKRFRAACVKAGARDYIAASNASRSCCSLRSFSTFMPNTSLT